MIGGTVIETIVLPDRVWINCQERNSSDQCAIYVENTPKSRTVGEGDTVWWQGGHAMWTPAFNKGKAGLRCGRDYDIRLNRIGCSGVKRP